MKKLLGLITVMVFSCGAFAQNYQTDKKVQGSSDENARYCAMMKDGKIIMMNDKSEMYADMNLSNGVTIKTDGTIIKSDKSQMMLKNGECVDSNGNIVSKSDKKEEDKMMNK